MSSERPSLTWYSMFVGVGEALAAVLDAALGQVDDHEPLAEVLEVLRPAAVARGDLEDRRRRAGRRGCAAAARRATAPGVPPHHADHSSPPRDQSHVLSQTARLCSTSAIGGRHRCQRRSPCTGDGRLRATLPETRGAADLRTADRPQDIRAATPWHRYAHHIRTLPARLEALAGELRRAAGRARPRLRLRRRALPALLRRRRRLRRRPTCPGNPHATLELNADAHGARGGRELRRRALDPGARARGRPGRLPVRVLPRAAPGRRAAALHPRHLRLPPRPGRLLALDLRGPAAGRRGRRLRGRALRGHHRARRHGAPARSRTRSTTQLPAPAAPGLRAVHADADRARRPHRGASASRHERRPGVRPGRAESRERACTSPAPSRATTSPTARRCCTRCSPRAAVATCSVHYLHGPDSAARPSATSWRGWSARRAARSTFRAVPDERCEGLPTRGLHAQGDLVPDLPARAAARARPGPVPRRRPDRARLARAAVGDRRLRSTTWRP